MSWAVGPECSNYDNEHDSVEATEEKSLLSQSGRQLSVGLYRY